MAHHLKTAFLSLIILLSPTSALAGQGDFFPVRSGLTAGPTSNGTGSSNEFNRFINSTPTVSDFRRQDRNNQNHWDERDFVTAKKNGTTSYDHQVDGLALGDQVWVEVYLHNNAEQTCNNQNQAQNTAVKLDWSNPQSLVGSISSADATPQTINDIVSFYFTGDYSFQRVSSENILMVEREQPHSGFCSGTPDNYDYKTTNLSSSDTLLTSEVNIGTVNGSYTHVKGVFFLLEVVPAQRSLEINKSASPAENSTVDAGNNINYSLTVTNTGNIGLQNVTLTDTLDQNLQYISGGSANGQTVTLSYGELNTVAETQNFIAQVRTDTPNGSQVCNSATGSGTSAPTVTSNNICHTINNPNGNNNQCGNETRDEGEQCDDGNTTAGDGCNSSCMWEYNGICGNNELEGPEECDDGNNLSGDGCSAICIDEDGTPTCGNDIWEQTEQCDDGNTISRDGCSATCQIENGGNNQCGNETRDEGEQCDDGNTIAGDGCNSSCMWEYNGICGNNELEGPEECDDGNNLSGDGCSAICVDEDGTPTCGNDIWEQTEQCDDGNTISRDGCSATCQIEIVTNYFSIIKSSTPDLTNEVAPGDNLIYNLTIRNNHSKALSDITVIDQLDPNLTYLMPEGGSNGISINGQTLTLVFTVAELSDNAETKSFLVQVDSLANTGIQVCNEASGTDGSLTVDSNKICHTINNSTENDQCGNGTRELGEQCDDGNTTAGDGCNSSCMWEYNGICGNNELEDPEECDDGNNLSGDGCSDICVDEDGTPTCGNDIWEQTEQCDDGNTISEDGCSATCQIENGGNNQCGNGTLDEGEQCDDGNIISEDGCSATCTTEPNSDDPGDEGGSATTNPTIGTCTVRASTGALQCTPRYPVEDTDDLDWQTYRDCRNDTSQTVKECLLAWAANKGYQACGDTYPTTGDMMIPYTGSSDADLVAQCNDTPPIINGSQPCDEITGAITKEIKHVNDSIWHDDEAFIQKGDLVDYRVSVNFDATPYISSTGSITSGTISIYDYTDYLGTSNPPIWERSGIVSEGWEPWIAGGIKHESPLTSGQINMLNATGQFTKTLRYRAHTNLMSDQDVYTIGNDAFAMLRLRVDTIDLSGNITTIYRQLAAGGNLCTIGGGTGTVSGVNIAEGTHGDDATAHIIRPFVEVRGGDAAFRFSDSTTSATQRVTGDAAAITGDTLSSGSVYVESTTPSHLSDFSDKTSFSSLADFQEFSGTADSDPFFANLKNNLSPVLEYIYGITNAQFSTTLGETNVYFIADTGTPTITGNLDMNGSSKTFVIDNGEDLIINNNFTITNGYAAFIVRNGGNIIIDKDVTEIEGIFIAEGSEITTSVDPTNWQFEQSYYQLTVSGMLVGDIRNLFTYRKFIGVSLMTLNDLQPNVVLLFDLRLLLATPPALEQVLGEGWRQDIEIE